jgi:hypothetical protein
MSGGGTAGDGKPSPAVDARTSDDSREAPGRDGSKVVLVFLALVVVITLGMIALRVQAGGAGPQGEKGSSSMLISLTSWS